MFSRLLNWLGLQSIPARKPRRPGSRRPRSATAHLFEKKTINSGQKPQTTEVDGDFNPYNTGKFDRSASWERISKNQR